jgi:DNA transformation protein and related proteins
MAESSVSSWLRDVFREVPHLTIKRMFGGHGVYRDGLMFALEADGQVYLKTDEELRPEFTDRGLEPFTYEAAGGRKTVMSYHEAPLESLEQPMEMALWAKKAWLAAQRAKKAKPAARKAVPRRARKDV